jgi:hypothetical protein
VTDNIEPTEPQPPEDFAQTTPKFNPLLHAMNTSSMIFEMQGTLGEVKQAVLALTNLVEQGRTRMDVVEKSSSDIKAALGRLEPMLGRMDDRARKLEVDTLPKLATDLGELKGRVSQLPTTIAIFTYMGGLVALTIVLFGAAFGVLKYLSH